MLPSFLLAFLFNLGESINSDKRLCALSAFVVKAGSKSIDRNAVKHMIKAYSINPNCENNKLHPLVSYKALLRKSFILRIAKKAMIYIMIATTTAPIPIGVPNRVSKKSSCTKEKMPMKANGAASRI